MDVHCTGKFTTNQTTALAVVYKVQYQEHVFMSEVTNVYCKTQNIKVTLKSPLVSLRSKPNFVVAGRIRRDDCCLVSEL